LLASGSRQPGVARRARNRAQNAAEASLSGKSGGSSTYLLTAHDCRGDGGAQAGDTVKLASGTEETLVLKTRVRVVGGPSTIDATGLDNGSRRMPVTSGAVVDNLTVLNSTFQGVYISGPRG
jgi:hypothetical protein